MKFKALFKSNTFLYRIWFLIDNKNVNGKKKELPQKSDNWYFDGYPRSGNTFHKNLLIFLNPNLNGVSHFHCIAGLKLALKSNLKSVIIFRDPLESVSSYFYSKTHREQGQLSNNLRLLEELLSEWIGYYNFVLGNIENDVFLFEFDSKEESIVSNILGIEKFLSLPASNNLPAEIKNFKKHLSLGENQKETAYSALPKKERTDFKIGVRSELLKLKNYKEAKRVYISLKEKS